MDGRPCRWTPSADTPDAGVDEPTGRRDDVANLLRGRYPSLSLHSPSGADDVSPTDDATFPTISPDTWRAQAERDLGRDLDRLRWRTDDGIVVDPLYHALPATLAAGTARSTDSPWLAEQAVDAPSIEEAADDARAATAARADRVVLCLDAAGRAGADADDAAYPVVDGVPITTALDAARLMSAGDLGDGPVRLEAGSGAFAAAALWFAARRRDRLDDADARLIIGADPIGHLARAGSLRGSAEAAVADAACMAAWCIEHAPGSIALLASTRAIHEAGGSPGQEIGWSVAVGLAWLRALEAIGVAPDRAASAIALERCVGPSQFEEIAAMRATRAVWARVLEVCGASSRATLLARTSLRAHTEVDPWVNAIRATTETFAAVCGGADAVLVEPWDAVPGPSDARGDRLARNTALVLRDESHIGGVDDPAAGSYFVESLTASLCQSAWAFLQDIERAGGPLAFLRDGGLAAAIEPVASRRAADIARRRRTLTGVTEFPPAPGPSEQRGARPERDALVARIGEGLDGHRARFPATDALSRLRDADDAERFPLAIEAASAGATLAAIVQATARGDDAQVTALPLLRDAAPFESLRARCDAAAARPRALLVGLGPLSEHNGRATWIANLLHIAGIATELTDPVSSAEDAAAAWHNRDADLAVLCGTDERYASLASSAARALRDAGCAHIAVAGRVEPWDDLRDAGVARRLFAGDDALASLASLLDDLGVS